MYNGAGATNFDGEVNIWFPYYTDSYNKNILWQTGSSDYYEVNTGFGLWNQTAAISAIRIGPDGWSNRTSFATGSTFTLYGIKGA